MKKEHILFVVILIFGAFFRLYGLNWDQGMHLHPDERFLTMVTNDIAWPKDIAQYFDTNTSPLNPHNKKFTFYVYGTWPVIITKYIAQLTSFDTYDGVPAVGRILAALCDILTLLIVYKIGRSVDKNPYVGLFASFLYATAVLPIQLSHFYTVDPFANLFVSLTLLWVLEKKHATRIALALGLAISAKISSMLLLPIVGLSYAMQFPWKGRTKHIWRERRHSIFSFLLLAITTIIVVRVAYPYLFTTGVTLNPKVLANWKELRSFEDALVMFPPALQWIHTTIALPLQNIAWFGLGLAQTLIFLTSILYLIKEAMQKKIHTNIVLILCFIGVIFLYQGTQFAKPMRYFWSAFPSIVLISSIFFTRGIQYVQKKSHTLSIWILSAIILLIILWPSMFMHIYTKPHTRVAASEWIYQNIKKGSTLSWEHWDDPLPLLLGNHQGDEYQTHQLPVFDRDSQNKWKTIQTMLSQSDYYILSSNRAYGAITNVAFRFPQTARFYELLFSGNLGFTLVAQFVSRPTVPLSFIKTCVDPQVLTYGTIAQKTITCNNGIQLVDDFSDETFTVYDHPKVLIFKKTDQDIFIQSMNIIIDNAQKVIK
ncbi:MAG: hypothetical protein AAB492_04410 [Patescibacteria group bacterium]